MRVGRSAIDEDAIRLLEQHNPEIQFDWSRILREPPPAQPRKEERRSRDRDRRPATRDARPAPPRPTAEPSATAAEHIESAEEVATNYTEPAEDVAAEYTEHTESAAEYPRPDSSDMLEPVALAEPEPLEPEPLEPEPAEPREPRLPVSPAEARLGTEGLARLRGRYAEVMARISERPLDEETREQLKLRAERLNPDTWVTADEVAEALEVYESVYEGLRALVGTRHRRRRGRGRRPGGQSPQV